MAAAGLFPGGAGGAGGGTPRSVTQAAVVSQALASGLPHASAAAMLAATAGQQNHHPHAHHPHHPGAAAAASGPAGDAAAAAAMMAAGMMRGSVTFANLFKIYETLVFVALKSITLTNCCRNYKLALKNEIMTLALR